MQAYSSPEREDDEHALPDIEVFFNDGTLYDQEDDAFETGWYWWSCFPGCLPDGEPSGPYKTEAEALADAQADAAYERDYAEKGC